MDRAGTDAYLVAVRMRAPRALNPAGREGDDVDGFKVLSLTDRAAERIKAIMAEADRPIAGLRVGVRNGGCAGMSYTMEYAEAASPARTWSRIAASGSSSIRRRCCSCSAPRWTSTTNKLAVAVRVQQPEPDLGLRLRRVRRDHAGRPRADAGPGLNRTRVRRRSGDLRRATRPCRVVDACGCGRRAWPRTCTGRPAPGARPAVSPWRQTAIAERDRDLAERLAGGALHEFAAHHAGADLLGQLRGPRSRSAPGSTMPNSSPPNRASDRAACSTLSRITIATSRST